MACFTRYNIDTFRNINDPYRPSWMGGLFIPFLFNKHNSKQQERMKMNGSDFKTLVDSRTEKCKQILYVKSEEYSTEKDRLHNFRSASQLRHASISDACLGMGMKHIVSIIDIVRSISVGNAIVTQSVIDEKFGDAINYLLLLEACITEEMKEGGYWK